MRRHDTNSVGGEQDAPAKIITHYKTSDPRGHDLRDRDGGHPPAADQRLAPAGAALQADVASAQQANLALEQDIANVGTDEAVMKIARERLNLVEDGEMIFIDSDK